MKKAITTGIRGVKCKWLMGKTLSIYAVLRGYEHAVMLSGEKNLNHFLNYCN